MLNTIIEEIYIFASLQQIIILRKINKYILNRRNEGINMKTNTEGPESTNDNKDLLKQIT